MYVNVFRDTFFSAQMAALYEASRMSSLRRLYTVPDGSHNDTYAKLPVTPGIRALHFLLEFCPATDTKAAGQLDLISRWDTLSCYIVDIFLASRYHRGGLAYFRAMALFIEDALRVNQEQGGRVVHPLQSE